MIQTLERADRIIAAVAGAPNGAMSLGELAAATGLHRSTAFTLARSLAALGWLDQDVRSRAYRLGAKPYAHARRSGPAPDVLAAARPAMLRLAATTRENVSLALATPGQATIVLSIEGGGAKRGATNQGRAAPYHASAVGKAILAHLDARARRRVLEGSLARYTRHTLTDARRLGRDLTAIQRAGYATALDEEETGTHAVAAPVFDRAGAVVGAIAVWGLASRLDASKLDRLGPAVRAECGAASEALAHGA